MQGKATVDHRQDVRRVLAVALLVNIVVSVLKLAVGVVSGSLAVIADAMHLSLIHISEPTRPY